MLLKHVDVSLNSYCMQLSCAFAILTLCGVMPEIYSIRSHWRDMRGKENRLFLTYLQIQDNSKFRQAVEKKTKPNTGVIDCFGSSAFQLHAANQWEG